MSGRPATVIEPGTVYPSGTVVREIERSGRYRRFVMRRACGHDVEMDQRRFQASIRQCTACARDAGGDRLRERGARLAEIRRAAFVRRRLRSFEAGPGGLLAELTLHIAEPDPCTIHDLRDLRRALGPDAWDLCGTVRADLAGERAA